METVNVYQIGLGSIGRKGFESLVELDRYFGRVNVKLKAVCDTDFTRLERAEKFAEANDLSIDTFQDVEEMYEAAEAEEGKVMIYDSGPSETHSRHIHRSLGNGFFHLAERPPSMGREEHLSEREMSKKREVMYMVDFIERESPVVKKASEIIDGKRVDQLDIFRQSSAGVQKVLEPVKCRDVKGGAVLDKMINEAFIFDLVDVEKLDMEEVVVQSFLPKGLGSDKFMSIRGGYTRGVEDNTALGNVKALFEAGGVSVSMHGSWMGFSEDARKAARSIKDVTSHDVLRSSYLSSDDRAFLNEQCRFFVVRGERDLAGDMLKNRLFDLETGEEVDVPELLHSQMFRVMETAVLNAAGLENGELAVDEIDMFMKALFDVQERAAMKDWSEFEELEKGRRRLNEMVVEDRKILEPEERDSLAG